MSTEGEALGIAAVRPLDLAGRRRGARLIVLAAAFVCAACGLVYELALVALGSYLIGSSITQTSLVISVVLCAMGLGALAAKPLAKRPVISFGIVEIALALVGGFSVVALYAAFAWLEVYTPLMLVIAVAIGVLIGAEIPLLMKLIQTVRSQDASDAVADLSAADYVGALAGGLAFPFLLLPWLGLVQGALLVGVVNVVAGAGIAAFLFARSLTPVAKWTLRLGATIALVLLLIAGAAAGKIETSARQALYSDPIVLAERTAYQEIVITQSPLLTFGTADYRLFLNGDLQFASVDEYRYHETLVHPAMNGAHARVLVLGGGDGLAVREILRYGDVADVTLVELDPAMTRLAATDDRLRTLNHHSLADPRVHVVNEDAFAWARSQTRSDNRWDVIVADFPDPDSVELSKLYSLEMYGMLAQLLSDGGRLVVQAGSPYFAPEAYWCIVSTVKAAGLPGIPYHVDVPSFGDWGYVLAQKGASPSLQLPVVVPPLRFLTPDVLRAATVFPADRAPIASGVSTLLEPRILDYSRQGWKLD